MKGGKGGGGADTRTLIGRIEGVCMLQTIESESLPPLPPSDLAKESEDVAKQGSVAIDKNAPLGIARHLKTS